MTTGNLAIQDNSTVVQYTSVGESSFVFPFPILETDELKVSRNQVLLTFGVDYSITGLGADGGGTITLLAGASTPGDIWTLWQDMPIERLTGFTAGAATLTSEALNAEFSARLRVEQQLRREIRNSLRIPPDDPVSGQNMLLPAKALRAGKYQAYDAAGQPIASAGTGNDSALRTDLATSLVGSQGSRLVGHKRPDSSALARTIYVAMLESLSAKEFAVGDGVADDTAALNNFFAAATHRDALIPAGTYKITGSLNRTNCNVIGAHKEFVTLNAGAGNFPIFVNPGVEFTHGCIKNITFMYNNGVKPTNAGTQGLQAAIRFATVGGKSPNFDLIENCEMRGAWWAFYDDSGSYASTLRGVFARACKNGFRKENGTTFHFDRCITGGDASNAGPDTAFFMQNNLAFKFSACASDSSAPGAGNWTNDFRSCTGLIIDGWDSEANTISGNDSALFSFIDCDGEFNASVEHANVYSENAGFVSTIRIDSSRMVLGGHRGRFSAGATEKTMAGNGTFYALLAQNAALGVVKSGSWNKPTIASGAPTLRSFHGTGTARIQFEAVNSDATIGSNSHEIRSDYYETAAQTITGLTTAPTTTLRARRTNQGVQLSLDGILTGTSNATTCTLTPALPVGFRPARAQTVKIMVVDNGVTQVGKLIIGVDGSLTLNKTFDTAAFTNVGVKAVYAQTLETFLLD